MDFSVISTAIALKVSCNYGRGRLGEGRAFIFFRFRSIRLVAGCCLFLARDEERDRSIAKHVMSVHINASGVNAGAQEGDIDIATMKKFVSYCRLKCAPRLSEAAATMLSSQVRWWCPWLRWSRLVDIKIPLTYDLRCFEKPLQGGGVVSH